MKNLLFFMLVLAGISAGAQNKNTIMPVSLVKGQRISVTNTNTSDADMGMGMLMKNHSVSSNIIEVTGENETEYLLTNTIIKLKASVEVMGETHDYDSENDSDRNSEMGKSLNETIGKPVNVTINKFSGVTVFVKDVDAAPEKPEKNPMEDLLAAFGNGGNDPSVEGAVIIIPYRKKALDSWTETDSSKGTKTIKTYTINSIINNIANISFTSVTDLNNSIEINGSQMDVSMSTKNKGEIVADTRTGLVSKRIVNSDISGTIDMMGQTMPISAKSNLVSEYKIL